MDTLTERWQKLTATETKGVNQEKLMGIKYILRGFEQLIQGQMNEDSQTHFRNELASALPYLKNWISPNSYRFIQSMTTLTDKVSMSNVKTLKGFVESLLTELEHPSSSLSQEAAIAMLIQPQSAAPIVNPEDEKVQTEIAKQRGWKRKFGGGISEEELLELEDEMKIEDEELEPIEEDEEMRTPVSGTEKEEAMEPLEKKKKIRESENMEYTVTHLSLAPLIWQDISTKKWHYALFADDQNVVFDPPMTMDTEEAATENLNKQLKQLSALRQNLSNYTFTLGKLLVFAWKKKVEESSMVCEDGQGTDRFTISDEYGNFMQYIVAFTSYGPNQLANNPDYKMLAQSSLVQRASKPVVDETFSMRLPHSDSNRKIISAAKVKEYLKTNPIILFLNHVVVQLRAVVPQVSLVSYDFVACPGLISDTGIVGIGLVAYSIPGTVSEELVNEADTKVFESLDIYQKSLQK